MVEDTENFGEEELEEEPEEQENVVALGEVLIEQEQQPQVQQEASQENFVTQKLPWYKWLWRWIRRIFE